MKIHELKCWPEYFYAIKNSQKPFEVRRDDRGFTEGDVLHLRLYDRKREKYVDAGTGAVCHVFLHVQRVWRYLPGLKEGYVVMETRRLVPEG
jgi:hypothetical protein